MHFDIKLKKNSKKKKNVWVPLEFYYRRVVFLDILKSKNAYKIASSLSNAITFLKKYVKQ